jgi:hypothetical protein
MENKINFSLSLPADQSSFIKISDIDSMMSRFGSPEKKKHNTTVKERIEALRK